VILGIFFSYSPVGAYILSQIPVLSGESIEEEMKNNGRACHFAQRVPIRAGANASWLNSGRF
jgi:hypothetical protein